MCRTQQPRAKCGGRRKRETRWFKRGKDDLYLPNVGQVPLLNALLQPLGFLDSQDPEELWELLLEQRYSLP